MDPLAALQVVDQSLSDCDTRTAIEFLLNYYQWRARGGFEPRGFDSIRANRNGDALADRLSANLLDQLDGELP